MAPHRRCCARDILAATRWHLHACGSGQLPGYPPALRADLSDGGTDSRTNGWQDGCGRVRPAAWTSSPISTRRPRSSPSAPCNEFRLQPERTPHLAQPDWRSVDSAVRGRFLDLAATGAAVAIALTMPFGAMIMFGMKCHDCGVSCYFAPSEGGRNLNGVYLLAPVTDLCRKCGIAR